MLLNIIKWRWDYLGSLNSGSHVTSLLLYTQDRSGHTSATTLNNSAEAMMLCVCVFERIMLCARSVHVEEWFQSSVSV